ncbi:MAG: phytoene/squalene synthase family protein [Ardenticatenaceae bacterium]|nr:phytoene/squalene synthase family protein [Ardenticatenaceae bacterium]MCB9445421.1 phytoene/squalene synthase family protein [Ardenticatenaceae bacterium]
MQQVQTWEPHLLAMAYEAAHPPKLHLPRLIGDQSVRQQAYTHCETLTAYHSRSFHMASGLLPAEKRRAVRALYAFCRVTDDIVDNNPDTAVTKLQEWRTHVFASEPPANDPVAVAWTDTRAHYHVPIRYAEQLVEGVTRDLTQTRYETFTDLATYCYSVASTVGLMSMHIIGYSGPDAIPYAIKLGLALQMTNILRDVAEDWERGRLYLPQDELAAFNLTEETIANGRVTEDWREFMRFQIERNRSLYAEAWPGIQMLNGDGRFAIAAAAGLYQAILQDIEQHDYDVFSRRAHIGTWGKLRRLPLLWWQSR